MRKKTERTMSQCQISGEREPRVCPINATRVDVQSSGIAGTHSGARPPGTDGRNVASNRIIAGRAPRRVKATQRAVTLLVGMLLLAPAYARADAPATTNPTAAAPAPPAAAALPTPVPTSVNPMPPAAAPAPAITPTVPPAPMPPAQPAEVFEVYPTSVDMITSRAEQSLVARVVQPDGVTRDVTGEVRFELPPIVRADKNVLHPVADGVGSIKVVYQNQSVQLPVKVAQATVDRPISFRLDVMPVFMRSGCNTGACHGAARGKDGFHLSLFGYDPDGDYDRLTRELATRRVNLALPAESLLLTKATGKVQHTGGTRFHEDSPLYATVMRWLDAGAPHDPPTVAAPDSVEILPRQIVLEGEGAHQQMTVRAHYTDGSSRDVTGTTVFLSNNDNSAKITESGLVTAGARGEAFVMARFNTFTVGSQVIVIPKGAAYQWPATIAEKNYIDTFVDAKLKKLRIIPSDVCTDEVYLRRAYIDVIGMLPTAEEHDRFVGDADPQKREKLIDELLGRKEFVDMWVMKWAELLQIRSGGENQFQYKAALLYYNWLEDRISHNVPMDKIVQELLGATGGTFKNPATNYYQVTTEALKISENTAQVFMGMRIQCAQCHNHPFDRWTMNDYYSFEAFFSQIGRKQAEDSRETIVFNSGGGEISHPVTHQPMKPKFLGGDVPDVAGKDRREVLAKWIASPQNPFFAKNLANIVWSHFLGHGIIDPVDDVRVSNPAVNPELLDTLGQKFTEYNYDFKRLVRDICTSRTYQLATETNATNEQDERNFSHGAIRRMRAEVMLDCITQVTETKEKFKGLPLGARAVQIADGNTSNYFLRTFGRASRESVCSCEVKMDPNLSQALSLLNGETHGKIDGSPFMHAMLKAKTPPAQIIDQLYMRCLSRHPLPDESTALLAQFQTGRDPITVTDDLFWALLNSQEFMFNH